MPVASQVEGWKPVDPCVVLNRTILVYLWFGTELLSPTRCSSNKGATCSVGPKCRFVYKWAELHRNRKQALRVPMASAFHV